MKIVNHKVRIAIVEDNELYNHLLTNGLKNYLAALPYDGSLDVEINSYTTAKTALSEIDENVDIVFLDYYLDDSVTGLDVLQRIKKLNPTCKVIIISQVENAHTSLDTLNEGAYDFILKDPTAIATSCHKAENMIFQKLRYA